MRYLVYLWGVPITEIDQISMINVNYHLIGTAYEVVPTFFEAIHYDNHFFVMNIIIEFCIREFLRIEGNRVPPVVRL